MVRKASYFILLVIPLLLAGCSASKRYADRPEVPIAITIKGDDPDLNSANLDFYLSKVLDELNDFQPVYLIGVEPDENPEITLELNIDNFTIWPKDQRVTRRVFSRRVVVGKDANGRTLYGTVRASADIIQEQIRTNARFSTNLRIKGTPGKTFDKVFSPSYRANFTYVENIQGDSRAIDPSLYTAQGPPIEPESYELLLILSKREMLGRISNEIRSYYDRKK